MKQKIFTFARKLITHAILISYLWLSIVQSYAMDPLFDDDVSDKIKYLVVGIRNIDRDYIAVKV